MLPLLLAALQTVTVTAETRVPADTVLLAADSTAMATAYADAGARDLVRLARGHRGVIDASVFRYTATTRQRISLGVRAVRRDRLIFRREIASHVDWRRDGATRVEVVGAREVVPIALPGVRVPGGLEGWATSFVPRPGDDRLFVAPDGNDFAWHPLVEGGEALYQYASGDTTVIRLPDGRSVRLVELRVTPRERDIRVVTGSFWIEMESYGIVQAVFRPAREFDLQRDTDEDDDVPALLRPVRFNVRYITVEYGLWEMRWWMPRLVLFDGALEMGPAVFPVSMELAYSDYTVEPDRYGLPELPPVVRRLAGDPHGKAQPDRYPTRVTVADTVALLASDLLAPSIHSPAYALASEEDMRELASRLGLLPPVPWQAARPEVTWPWVPGGGLVRYNRVEGLSAGVRMDWNPGPARMDVTARLGLADMRPGAELGMELPALRRAWRAAAYRRLVAANPVARPFRLGNSTGALLFGQDDGVYFRTNGAELRMASLPGAPRHELRLYAERQSRAGKNTDFSLRRLMDEDRQFQPNMAADRADQVGIMGRVGLERGHDPVGLRLGGRAEVTAETGSYTFARPGLILFATLPLPGDLLAGGEAGAGTTLAGGRHDGSGAPVQALWYLGGPATLRGFAGDALSGPDHLRARLEVGTRWPAARLVVFSDAAWAGELRDYRGRDIALSAGVGGSFLDGLIRADVAHALRPARRWRLELYVDGLF